MKTSKSVFRHLLSAALVSASVLAIGTANHARAAEKLDANYDLKAIMTEFTISESEKTAKEMTPGWVKPKKMLIAGVRGEQLAWLQAAVPSVQLIPVKNGTDEEVVPMAADVDAILGASNGSMCTVKVLAAAKKLKWIQNQGAGVDGCVLDVPAVSSGKYLVTNRESTRQVQMAENAIAYMVALSRNVDYYVKMDATKSFKNRPNFHGKGWLLTGRTALVVGLGGNGTEIAKRAHGLGMRVIATRNSSHEGPDYVEYVGLANELPNLVGQADVVIMAAPLTKETTGLFNKELFAKFKKGAYLVNIARGGSVVTDDLVAALNSGQVGGFGGDVTDPEPLPDGHPLWDAPNIIITQHGGGPAASIKPDPIDPYMVILRENLMRYTAGDRKMLAVVDVKRGY